MVPSDPAAQLERVLIGLVRSPSGGTLAESIAEVTQLESAVDPQWRTKAAMTWLGICNMLPEIAAAMYQIPDIHHDAYLRPIRELAPIFLDMKLDEPTSRIPLVVERRHIDALTICSDLLSRDAGLVEVESGDARNSAPTIEALVAEVRSSAAEVPADEMPQPSGASVAIGVRRHRATQNSLARFLASREVTLLLPTPSDPAWDIAWEEHGTMYVGEVKSLTTRNEERQLGLGLGQVLRHRQAVSRPGRAVVGVLAIERQPSDPTWLTLCRNLDVRLVWPGAWDDLVREGPVGRSAEPVTDQG